MSLNEAETRAKLIDPRLHACGWTEEHIKREETAGPIQIIGGKPRRGRGRVDYTLRIKVSEGAQPIAVALIEAKAEGLPPAHGLEQAKLYADCERMSVPFVYSTNGHLFVEYDRYSQLTSAPTLLTQFPTPAMLRARYEEYMGFSLADPLARPLLMRYPGGETSRRYYQDAAIRAALEKIARGEKRVLLSLATGAGKTFIAVNLLKKVADAGQLRRALFICDRDELRTQGTAAFQNVFGNDAAPVSSGNPQRNARILIATYQTLDVDTDDADANFLRQNYPENYFSHIVIDECHRSAWGKWSEVLRRNPNAAQIGLTATPRQLKAPENTAEARADLDITSDNIRHFGEPAYEYEMGQGIEDGYLAACEIRRSRVNLDNTGVTIEDILARSPVDANTGQPITEEQMRDYYTRVDYEDQLLLPDRVWAMALDLFEYLLEATGDPHQKTIIFCVRDRHADDVASALNNIYAHWCAEQGTRPVQHYAFKCTAASGGSDYLADLRGAPRSHFIATTVDLLSTGVDVPVLENIAFFKYVRSPISFYQMIGRGTRLHPPTGKLMFRVYDYTDATRLFGEEFVTRAQPRAEGPGGEGAPRPVPPQIQAAGFDVHITDAGRYILISVDGKAMPVTVEEYKEHLAARLIAEAPTLENFRAIWVHPEARHGLLDCLPDGERSALLVQQLDDMKDYDLYDVLAELGYGLNPRTRLERAGAFSYKHENWLAGLPERGARTIRALAMQFARAGTEGLESPRIFETPEVRRAGGLPALREIGEPASVLRETKERMFAA